MMKSKKLLIIIMMLALMPSYLEIGYAVPFGNLGSSTTSIPWSRKHFIRIAPRPPGWPQIHFAEEVYKFYYDQGGMIEKTPVALTNDNNKHISKTKDAIMFTVSDSKRKFNGCILEFDRKSDFNEVYEYYHELNESNVLYTWSMIKGNILVVIDGKLPENMAAKYKSILAKFK